VKRPKKRYWTWQALIRDILGRFRLSPVDRTEIKEIGLFSWTKLRLSKPGLLVRVKVRGYSIRIRSGTPDLEVALTSLSGEFEDLRGLLPAEYAGKVLDVGGYIGTATLALRRIFPIAEIICIEPSTENMKVLKLNLKGHKNISVVNAALVGSARETANLFDRGTGEWGFTLVEDATSSKSGNFLNSVRAMTLSDFGVGTDDVGIIKLDIEGGEFEVMKFDAPHLQMIPVIFAELHDDVVPGCSSEFFKMSSNRELVHFSGEKWLSLRKDLRPPSSGGSRPKEAA